MDQSGTKALNYAFTGMYDHALDPKGRLTLPSLYRDELANERRIIFAISPDKQCLAIHPESIWQEFLGNLRSLPRTVDGATSARRVILSTAFACEMDRQGRVLVPHQLRELAGITREVKVTGNLEVVEVWDRSRWEEYFRQGQEQLAVNASKLSL